MDRYGMGRKRDRFIDRANGTTIPTDEYRLKVRLVDLMFFRVLQIDRHINIETAQKALDGTDGFRQKIGGIASGLKKVGAISDNGIIGTDQSGYPFKDWGIGDAHVLRTSLKYKYHLGDPLSQSALEVIRKRSNVDTSE